MKFGQALVWIILSTIISNPAWSALYKCTDKNGQVAYQEKPCEDEKSISSEIKIDTRTPTKPARITRENKNLFASFTAYQNLKVTVNECVNRESPYAEEISQAHQRYYEIAKNNIDTGRDIFERGFVGLPSSELRSIQRKAKAEKKIEFRSMASKELDRLCDSQARMLRRLASQVDDRSSGYQEGDLDPEGND